MLYVKFPFPPFRLRFSPRRLGKSLTDAELRIIMNKGSQSKGSQREKESKPTRDKRETKQQRAFVEDLANKVKVRRVENIESGQIVR